MACIDFTYSRGCHRNDKTILTDKDTTSRTMALRHWYLHVGIRSFPSFACHPGSYTHHQDKTTLAYRTISTIIISATASPCHKPELQFPTIEQECRYRHTQRSSRLLAVSPNPENILPRSTASTTKKSTSPHTSPRHLLYHVTSHRPDFRNNLLPNLLRTNFPKITGLCI